MAGYSKEDVDQHPRGYGYGMVPAVNVKTDPWSVDRHFGKIAEEYDDPSFVEWAERQSDDFWNGEFEFACEVGWEDLQSDAEEIFGQGVKVYSEGRSGGWAIVDGLKEFEDWDAVDLAKWRKFERWAKDTAQTIPESMVELAYINAYSAERERCQQAMTQWSEDLLASLVLS